LKEKSRFNIFTCISGSLGSANESEDPVYQLVWFNLIWIALRHLIISRLSFNFNRYHSGAEKARERRGGVPFCLQTHFWKRYPQPQVS